MIFYILFIISIIVAFVMLLFRVWEIKTMRISPIINREEKRLEISFRYLEKNLLYIIKKVIIVVVTFIAKYWIIIVTKIKKEVVENWPKIHKLFKPKTKEIIPRKHSFVSQTILESKARISRIKEKIKKEHA